MSDPSFWENGDHAKEISQKDTEAKAAYDTYTRLFARAESIKELLDMAIEENDQDMESELEEEIHELKDILDKKEIELLIRSQLCNYYFSCRGRRHGSTGLDCNADPHVHYMGRVGGVCAGRIEHASRR